MAYILLDESGDLGFSTDKHTSKYFIVTVVAVEDKKILEKIVRKVHRSLRKKVKRLSGGILHCYKEKDTTRKKLLKLLIIPSVSIMTICLNKRKVYTKFHDEKHVLYNYVTNILLDRIISKKLVRVQRNITLIAARRETNKFLNENFTAYLHEKVKRRHNIPINIVIKTPAEEKGLQAVDFVCWALFRKYEYKDDTWYSMIASRIFEENMLFP